MPFTAPIIVTHERPDAFDNVRFFGAGAQRIQVWGVAAALAPHQRRASIGWTGAVTVIELAVHTFFHGPPQGYGFVGVALTTRASPMMLSHSSRTPP